MFLKKHTYIPKVMLIIAAYGKFIDCHVFGGNHIKRMQNFGDSLKVKIMMLKGFMPFFLHRDPSSAHICS